MLPLHPGDIGLAQETISLAVQVADALTEVARPCIEFVVFLQSSDVGVTQKAICLTIQVANAPTNAARLCVEPGHRLVVVVGVISK
jgi:hypothetical protein